MTTNTKKAIARRLEKGLETFRVGRYTYYADYRQRIVIHYAEYLGANPQIDSFDYIGFNSEKE